MNKFAIAGVALISLVAGGVVGANIQPNETSATCVLAFSKGDMLFSLAADASRTNDPIALGAINGKVNQDMPIYKSLRDRCIEGE